MQEFVITNYKYGLDTRKDVLTSQPGTLVTCENAHINPGGEIEKRKTFAEFADLLIFDDNSQSISGITRSGTTATATSNGHGLAVGDYVKISGAVQTEYNGEVQLIAVTTNTFDYTVSGSPVTPATGTIVFDDLGTFGLEVTDAGILTFGSASPNGGSSAENRPRLEAAMPTGVTYQQLEHPEMGLLEQDYQRTVHRMTEVVFSENFNGKAFVAATFADGNTFLFYDGTLIEQSCNGLVTTNGTALGTLALLLQRQLINIGWVDSGGDATALNVDENAVTQNGSFLVKSPQSDYFKPIATYDSDSGRIGVKNISIDGAATAGTRAVATFEVTTNTGPFSLSAFSDALGSTAVDLCGGNVTAGATLAATASAIAQAVNDLTSVHGYSALVEGVTAKVAIFAPISFGAVTFNLTVTGTATSAAAAAPTTPLTFLDPNPLVVERKVSSTASYEVSGSVTAQVAGGTAPYTFAWSEVDAAGHPSGIEIVGASDKATVVFSKVIAGNTEVTGQWKVLVTDNVAATYTAYVTVTLRAVFNEGQ